MNIQKQIENYIASLPEKKQVDLLELHRKIIALKPEAKLWFLDGKNADGKVVSNPNIGYGTYTITYAKGNTQEFYQVGLSANTTGISVYILGFSDKKYLMNKYANAIGKASITGYCIKFKSLKEINVEVLLEAILDGFKNTM